MLSAPYIAQIAFSTAALVGSLQHPEHVSRARRFFYCTLKLQPLSMAMALFTAIVGVGIGIAMSALRPRIFFNLLEVDLNPSSLPLGPLISQLERLPPYIAPESWPWAAAAARVHLRRLRRLWLRGEHHLDGCAAQSCAGLVRCD
jgi:hypothetical protein